MSPTRSSGTWPGCHGVRLEGEPIDLGISEGLPLTLGSLRFAEVAAPSGTRLWSQDGEAAAMYRRDDGRFVLAGPRAAALEVDAAGGAITVGAGDAAVQRQLVASFGIPLLLHGQDVLLVHGSACARDSAAIVVCADSGSGKSSMLVRLVDDGWQSLSEDLCTIDLREPQRPRVWPGPPWVRVAHGEPGPRGASIAFESADKAAWDLSGSHASAPVDLARVVLLDPPGGDEPAVDALSHADALRALARHAVWLQDADERGRRLFEPVAKVAATVPSVRVRLPRRDSWRDEVPELLGVT